MKLSLEESFLQSKSLLFFYFLLLLVLIDRTNTLVRFSFIYTDSDQTVLWLATHDMTMGKFYTLCFYGQSYNPLIEPILAFPLVKIGLSYPIALPLITTILALAPFIFLAFYYKKKLGPEYGLLPFIFLLLLSPEYGMIASMPRGFVTGIFFSTIGLICLLKDKKIFDFVGSILLTFSLFANPNTVLLFPLALPALFTSTRSFKTKLPLVLAGGALGLIPQIFNSVYYHFNPQLIVHNSPDLGLSLESFSYVVQHLPIYFDWITPAFWKFGWLSLLLIVVAAWKFGKSKKKIYLYTTILVLSLIVLSFFSNKVSDGRDSVYFAGSRMFLAYPIILLFITIWYLSLISSKKRAKVILGFLVLGIITLGIKLIWFDFFVKDQIRNKDYTVVGTIKVNDLQKTCLRMMNFADNPPDLILANSPNSSDQLVTYGCGCLMSNFPPTLQPQYDRRTWLISELLNKRFKNVLLHGEETKAWDTINRKNIIIVNEDPQLHWLMIKNDQTTKELMIKLNLIK